MALNVGTLVAHLKLDSSQFTSGISTAKSSAESFTSGVASTLKKAAIPIAALGAGFGVVAVSAISSAADIEKKFAEVFTLVPGESEEFYNQMTQDAKDFAVDMGATLEDVSSGMYQAISAGIPSTEVFDFLEVAQQAAVGGVTDLETAVDGITSVINAYGSDVISATEASDLMFTAVKLGKTNFEELSGYLYQVIPTASSLGLSFDNVTAALSTMTAQGTPTCVAATQLRQLLVELSKSGTKTSDAFINLSGKTFKDFIADGNSLQDALKVLTGGLDSVSAAANDNSEDVAKVKEQIKKYTDQLTLAKAKQKEFGETTKESTKLASKQKIDDLTSKISELKTELSALESDSGGVQYALNDLFGSVEAGNAALALTGKGAEKFASDFEEMGGAAGATETAFDTMEQTFSRRLDKIKARIEVATQNFGEALIPYVEFVLDWWDENGEAIVKPIMDAFGALKSWWDTNGENIITNIVNLFKWLGDTFKPVFDAFADFWSGEADLMSDWWDENGDMIIEAATNIGNAIKWLIDGIVKIWEWVWPYLETIMGGGIDTLLGIIELFAAILTGDWDKAGEALGKITEGIFKMLYGIISLGLAPIKAVFEIFFDVFKSIFNGMKSVAEGVTNAIVGFFEGMWNGIKTVINFVIDGVNTMINALNSLSFTVPDWVPVLGGNKFGFDISTIPRLAEGGIVTEPTLAMIGEGQYDEAVIPLDGRSGFGGQNISINVDKMEVRKESDIKRVAQELATLINTQNRGKGVNYGR